jgi:tetratricopeptide (TPR) repeat protein
MTTRREVQRTMPFIAELIGCRWDGSSLNALDDPRLRHDNQIMAVNALVAALAETASLVIQLEDMQWIDSSTAQWLHMMTRNLAHLPIAILGTSRFANDGNTPALSFGSHVPTRDIELRPIADTNFPMKMAEALLSAELDQDTLRMISERAEGNPFFTEQLLLHLRETGQLEQKQTGKLRAKNEFWRLPGSLSALLTTRIDRLSPQLQDVIKHAAILGVYFLLPVLRQLMLRSTNINVNDKLLSEAERQAILMRALTEEAQRIHSGTSGEDLYFFRHALLRNAAYSLQVPSVRARLHGLALEIIETLFVNDLEPFLVEIADHARFAQHPNDPKSAKYALDELRYLQLAASSAKAAYRNSEAARLFERIASVISADPALRAEALIQAGHACRHIGDVEMAQRHYERALARVRESGDHCGEEEALEGLGAVFADQGEMRAARVHFERALELKRVRRDRRGEGKSLWNLAYLAWRQGEAEDARVHWEHALAIAREIGSQIDEGEALGPLGNLHRDQGRLDEARALYTRSLEIHRDTGNQVSVGIVLGNIGIVDQRHGRIAEARQHYTFALTIHREFGNRRFEGRVLCDMGHLALAQEQWAESHEYLDQALVIAQEVENRHDESIALGYLGDLFLAQGMRVEARRHYERAVQLSREIGSRRWEGVFLATLGTLDAIEDQLDAAAIHFEAASKLLTYVNATDYLGALEVQRGHLDLAQFRAAQQGVVAAAAQGSLEAIPGKTPAPEQHLDAATRRLYAARTVVAPVGSVIGQAVRLLQAAIEEQKNRKGMTQ